MVIYYFAAHQSQIHQQHSVWGVRNRHLVLFAVPRGIRKATKAVRVRVLLQVYETREDIQGALGWSIANACVVRWKRVGLWSVGFLVRVLACRIASI